MSRLDLFQLFLIKLQTIDLLLSHKVLDFEFNIGQTNETTILAALQVLLGKVPVSCMDKGMGGILLGRVVVRKSNKFRLSNCYLQGHPLTSRKFLVTLLDLA